MGPGHFPSLDGTLFYFHSLTRYSQRNSKLYVPEPIGNVDRHKDIDWSNKMAALTAHLVLYRTLHRNYLGKKAKNISTMEKLK